MKGLVFAVVTAALLAGIPAASAEECGPLKIFAQIRLQPSESGLQEYVPVEIAGVAKTLLLDTGAAFSQITEHAAHELGLTIKTSAVRLYSLNGTYSERAVSAPFALGSLKGPNLDFQISPLYLDDNVVGILGADILGQFDISIDFGMHTMDIVSPDHCDGRVKYWKEQPLAIVPITLSSIDKHIIVPVLLDGQQLKAIVDTGASNSTVNRPFAERRLGVKLGSDDTPASGELNGEEGATMWRHRFHTLTLEGITVSNPEFSIIPERLRKHFGDKELGSLISRPSESLEPEALLGMNVLKHLHVYFAYKEKKLYITPSAAEVPATPPAALAVPAK